MADVTPPVPPTTPPPAASDWTTGLSDDAKAYVANKGFKDPAAVLESYRNFEKLQGVPQDRILKLPESMDTPEGRAVWERLGTPKEAKDYGFEVPKGADPKDFEQIAAEFHKAGVPKSMAQNIIKAMGGIEAAKAKIREDAMTAASTTAEANLKTEWGAAFDKNKNIVEQAVTTLGLTKEQVQTLARALGPEGTPKLLLKLGQATSEHTFVQSQQPNNGPMTPGAADAKIQELRSNADFVSKLTTGDKAAMAEWQRVHEMAYQGLQSFT